MPRKITYKKRGRKSGGGIFDRITSLLTGKSNNSQETQATPLVQQTNSVSGQAPTTAPVPGGKRKTIKNKTKKSKK